jgi:hypothetical protein
MFRWCRILCTVVALVAFPGIERLFACDICPDVDEKLIQPPAVACCSHGLAPSGSGVSHASLGAKMDGAESERDCAVCVERNSNTVAVDARASRVSVSASHFEAAPVERSICGDTAVFTPKIVPLQDSMSVSLAYAPIESVVLLI